MVTIIDVNGAEMYAHTAWAESPDGDSFSTVEFDDADYIGTLIDRNAAEETDPTKYTWRYADAGMEEDEEDEEDEDVTADLSSDLEELADNVAEVADQINQQQVDFINTQNVTDGAIGNVNELNGTNDGVHGWTVPDGFRISQSYEDVDANPDTENVLVSTITRNTSGTDAAATFDATELVISLAGADAGNAYTISLQSRMSELFEIPVSVSKSDGTNVMLDFGVINNAVTVEPEEPEEEDAGTAEAAEEDPTVDEIIADEEGADDTPTGEIAGAGAWSWFESTAETASVTADAQELRFDLAEMPVGAELSIANLKIEAGAMATPWRRSIKEVAGIAAEAQSTAQSAAATAKATASHFWLDAAGQANVSTDAGTVETGHSVTIGAKGIIQRLAGKLLSSFTGLGTVFYDGTADSPTIANVIASFGSDGAIIGKKSGANIEVDSDSVSFMDSGTRMGYISDSRLQINAGDFKKIAVGKYVLRVDSDGTFVLGM